MEITTERAKGLKGQTYGTLQSTPEFKHFLDNYVYNASKNMTSEVDYILKKSIEDDEAPLSYEDVPCDEFDEEQAIKEIVSELQATEEDEYKDTLEEINNEYEPFNLLTFGSKEETIARIEQLLNIEDIDPEDFLNKDFPNIYTTAEDCRRAIEVYQWFMMDSRLLYQLENRGEVVLNGEYWGRQCCGQSIELDGVIIEIFKEWFIPLYEVSK